MQIILQAFLDSIQQVGLSFLHNWPFLLASILLAAAFKLYLKPEKVSAFLLRHRKVGVLAATAAAVGTPLCSCGTTAVLLGMLAGSMPWAPIVAFMVASPLSSPGELIYSAGLFGWPFAIAYFGASILLGLIAGGIATALENRGWFRDQSRFASQVNRDPRPQSSAAPVETCACNRAPRPVLSLRAAPACCGEGGLISPVPAVDEPCGCSGETGVDRMPPRPAFAGVQPKAAPQSSPADGLRDLDRQLQIGPLGKEAWLIARRLLPMFFGFAFIGFFLNGLVPQEWIGAVFGAGHVYSVPLAATLALPLYVNSDAALPLVLGLIQGGMSQGAALAFLLCGSGTSLGAVAGALTIARWRVIALVVAILWLGGMSLGLVYDAALAVGLF